MNIAGIDIGSNATRVTISKAHPKGSFHTPDLLIEKVRFPCRLGDDVFTDGSISDETASKMHSIFSEIKNILQGYQVEKIKSVATSAFRDAQNGDLLASELQKTHQIPCEIISGAEEAKLMSSGLLKRGYFDQAASNMHVDMGGGSLEVSIYDNSSFTAQTSIDIGPLRLLEDHENGKLVLDYKDKIKGIDNIFIEKRKAEADLCFLGTGGNFKRIGSLSKHVLGRGSQAKFESKDVPSLIDFCKSHPGKKLSKKSSIKNDNASLVLPSLLMIERLLKNWPAKNIEVPSLSLSHVLLDELN